MDKEPLTPKEINSELTGLNKGEKLEKKKIINNIYIHGCIICYFSNYINIFINKR